MSFLGDWGYRKKLTVTGTVDGALTDYCIGIKVYYGPGADGTESGKAVTLGKVYTDSKCKTDFGDIRFTEDDGVTELGYWMEEKTDSDFAIFWIKLNSIPISPNTVDIYVYYGNDPISTTSDGDSTFLVFDHFDGVALDTDKWDEVLNGNTRLVEDGYLKVWIDAGASYYINSKLAYDFPDNAECMTRMDMKAVEGNTGILTVQVGRFIDRNAVVSAPGIGWYSEGNFDRRVYGDVSQWWNGSGRGCATGVSRHAVSTISDDYVRHFCEGVKNFGPEDFYGFNNYPTSPDRYIRWLLNGRNVIQGWLDWIAVRPRSPTEPLPTSWSAKEENPIASLKAIFHVGQDSRDLFATFGVKQWRENLFAKTNIVHWKDLFARANIVQWESLLATFHVGQDSEDLKGTFIVRRSSSEDLQASVEITHWAQLKGIFVTRRTVPDYSKFEVFAEYLVDPLLNTQDDVVRESFQRKVWHANGRHWIFGVISRDFKYWHSANGQNWTGPIKIIDVTQFEAGRQISTWVDAQGYLHYVYAPESNNGNLVYRKGFLESDGTITWSAAQQTVYNPPSDVGNYYPGICVDSEGYPWITWYYLEASPLRRRVYVTKSDTKDGTWTTNPNYPALLSDDDNVVGWAAYPYPISGGRVVVWFGGNNTTDWYAVLCDENGAGSLDKQASAGDWDTWYSGGAITVGDALYAAYGSTSGILYLNKWENGSWGTEVVIQDPVRGAQCPVFFRIGTYIFVTWMNTDADEIRYKISRDAGASWTPAGVTSYHVLMTSTVGGWGFNHPTRRSMGIEPQSVLGHAYNLGATSDLYYSWLEPTAETPDLFAKFEVGQGSGDLKAVFRLTQEILFAKMLITRPGSEVLFSKFIVRQADAVDLFSKFELAQWEDLYCTFRVRKILNFEGSLGIGFKWWGAGGWDQMVDFELWTPTGSFLASFPDGPAAWRWIFLTFKDVPGSTAVFVEKGIDGSRPDKTEVAGIFWTYHSAGVRRVDSIYIWRAAELKAIFTVRQPGSQDLYAKFEAQASADLKAEFGVKQWYADLKAVFHRGIVETVDLKAVFEVNHFDFFGPWTVVNSNEEAVAYPHQETVFRWPRWPTHGRHWVFYIEPDTNNLGSGPNYWYMFYKTSEDGENWSAEGIIKIDGQPYDGATGSKSVSPNWGPEGRQFSAWVTDDGIVHIAVCPPDGFAGNDLFYKRGVMSAGGSISWDAAVLAVTISSTSHCKWPTICCDADGYPYITWYEQTGLGGQGTGQNAFIARSTTKDGTWTLDQDYYTSGRYVGKLSSNTQIRYMAKPIPLDDGTVYAFFGGDAEQEPWWPSLNYDAEANFRGRLCDENGMGGQTVTPIGSRWQLFYGGAATNIGNVVVAAIMCEDLTIRVCKWSNGVWLDPAQIIQTVAADGMALNTTPVFFQIPGYTYPTYTTNDKIVIAWIDEATQEVRYKVSSDGGDTWHPGGDANYCVLMTYPTGFGTGSWYQGDSGFWGKYPYWTIHNFSIRDKGYSFLDQVGFAFVNELDQLMFGYITRSDQNQ